MRVTHGYKPRPPEPTYPNYNEAPPGTLFYLSNKEYGSSGIIFIKMDDVSIVKLGSMCKEIPPHYMDREKIRQLEGRLSPCIDISWIEVLCEEKLKKYFSKYKRLSSAEFINFPVTIKNRFELNREEHLEIFSSLCSIGFSFSKLPIGVLFVAKDIVTGFPFTPTDVWLKVSDSQAIRLSPEGFSVFTLACGSTYKGPPLALFNGPLTLENDE